jgi:hypothetical protein
MQPERVSTSIELPRDLYRRLHEIAARHGCSTQQLILQRIESAVATASRQRPKKRLNLDEPLLPPTGGPINPTEEQIYGGIEFP